MTDMEAKAIKVLANAIKGPFADHHASVIVSGIWMRSYKNEGAAYSQVLKMAERYSNPS